MNATRPSRGPSDAVTAAPFVVLRTRLTAELERVLDRGADDRARHAVPSTAAATQFGPDDGDDLHPGLTQQGVGVGVAVVSEHHTGLHGDEVVTAVPLL